MDNKPTINKYIATAYKLYAVSDEGREFLEEATVQRPFIFISGLSVALPAFEEKMLQLEKGDEFDFTLNPSEAYGEYDPDAKQAFPLEMFHVNGKFDVEHVYEGADIPLVNEEGQQFMGHVEKTTPDAVHLDFNHPLAGQALHFKGTIVESREATPSEIEQMIRLISGHGCEGGCGGCGDGGCDNASCDSNCKGCQ